MAKLFSPFQINDVSFRNRIGMSPMCQYSSIEGVASDWHMVHLGSRAVGGAGLVMTECTAVSDTGRISNGCAGLWNQTQVSALEPITAFVKAQGAVPGIQISHSGRKGSAQTALEGGNHLNDADGGWTVCGPTAEPFDADGKRLWKTPARMTKEDIASVQDQFVHSAILACEAGYQLLEVHCAHGYLLHSFLSPLINTRDDEYGGNTGRARMLLETVEKVRAVWPGKNVLSVRMSVHDFTDDGLSIEDTAAVAIELKQRGVDIIDCSAGGGTPAARGAIGNRTAEQPDMAGELRQIANIPTMAVGCIRDPQHAELIVTENKADIVLLGRQFLRDPFWPYRAAHILGHDTRHILSEQSAFFVGAEP